MKQVRSTRHVPWTSWNLSGMLDNCCTISKGMRFRAHYQPIPGQTRVICRQVHEDCTKSSSQMLQGKHVITQTSCARSHFLGKSLTRLSLSLQVTNPFHPQICKLGCTCICKLAGIDQVIVNCLICAMKPSTVPTMLQLLQQHLEIRPNHPWWTYKGSAVQNVVPANSLTCFSAVQTHQGVGSPRSRYGQRVGLFWCKYLQKSSNQHSISRDIRLNKYLHWTMTTSRKTQKIGSLKGHFNV